MASPNESPAFSKASRRGSVRITLANTSSAGGGTIGTDIFLLFTADATNGSLIQRVRFMPTATAALTTTATVGRVFISTKSSGVTTNADTFLWAEMTLLAVNADNATAQVAPYDVPMGIWLPPGDSILVTNHATPAANTAWIATVLGQDY